MWIQASPKPSLQCANDSNKRENVLRYINMVFMKLDVPLFDFNYLLLLIFSLEFFVQSRGPWLKNDIELLKSARRCSKHFAQRIIHLNYSEKQHILTITSVAFRIGLAEGAVHGGQNSCPGTEAKMNDWAAADSDKTVSYMIPLRNSVVNGSTRSASPFKEATLLEIVSLINQYFKSRHHRCGQPLGNLLVFPIRKRLQIVDSIWDGAAIHGKRDE